jgi:H+/gluconate symporter-like permease
VAGRAIKLTWENKPLNGYFITDYGNIIAFQPATVEIDNSIMTMMILIAVAVSVPGVIIGLIYMNSPFLQRKYAERRKRIWKKKELQRSDNRK